MIYSKIVGTGSYLPPHVRTNADIEKMVDTSDAWIRERTGIHQRHIAGPEDSTASMAVLAAKAALSAAAMESTDIDLIVIATSTPDHFFPSTACLVQEKLGIPDCAALDVGAACAGFNYALAVADGFIRSGMNKRALVIGSEVMSRIIDWTDRGTCILFGDGAGAVVLEASAEPGIFSHHLHAAGQYKDLLYTPNGLHTAEPAYMKMRGSEVFKIAVTKLGDLLEEILTKNHVTAEKIDWFIPHQANLRIIQAAAKKMNLTFDRVVITLDKHGNTSAASIPLALDSAVRDGRIQRGQLLLLEGFGGGFTWGGCLIKY